MYINNAIRLNVHIYRNMIYACGHEVSTSYASVKIKIQYKSHTSSVVLSIPVSRKKVANSPFFESKAQGIFWYQHPHEKCHALEKTHRCSSRLCCTSYPPTTDWTWSHEISWNLSKGSMDLWWKMFPFHHNPFCHQSRNLETIYGFAIHFCIWISWIIEMQTNKDSLFQVLWCGLPISGNGSQSLENNRRQFLTTLQ